MAQDPCCNDIIGGEVFITARFPQSAGGGFARYEGMGDVNIEPTRVERTATATSGGSIAVTETPRPARAILSFVNRCSSNPMRLFKGRCQVDVTVVEKSRGFQHDFTNALIVGLPRVNLTTGEITGMEIATDEYSTSQYSVDGSQVGGTDILSGLLPV